MAQVLKPEVRDRILSAATEAFAERGLRAAAVADIARRADVSAANIYRYFPTKEALFEVVLSDDLIAEHDRLLDERVDALARSDDDRGPAENLLAFWVANRLAIATLLDHPDETSRSGYADSFVERLTRHVEGNLAISLDPLRRELLVLVFDNTRRALARILRSTSDPDELRFLVSGFWSYQVPGLDGLLAWIAHDRPDPGL